MTTVTMRVDGQEYQVPEDQVIPWLLGVHGTLGSLYGGDRQVVIDADPAASDRPGMVYLIEVDGVGHLLAEDWVLPWMRGLAVRHGIESLGDPHASERAQRIQALMIGHQLGLIKYIGFRHQG
jgi:hypothetical protein